MKVPLILILIVIFSLCFQPYLHVSAKEFLYALSLSVKEGLLFALPFIIFFFILNSVIKLQGNAIKLLVLMVAMICISNFTSTWVAYDISNIFDKKLHTIELYENIGNNVKLLVPSWKFSLPKLINNEISVIAAVIIGSIIVFLIPKLGKKISKVLVRVIDFTLSKILLPVIPVFIAGFIIKLAHDQVLLPIIHNYLFIFLVIFSSSISYIVIWHLIILRCVGIKPLLKNLTPPLVTGFSTMSSAIAMPLLILATEKSVKDRKIMQAVIPVITNFHLVGDCFAIPILALTIMSTFGHPFPDLYQYLMFSLYFVVTKFAVAAVPGGGILVMLPVLKSTLGFTDAMLSLITTLYIMFDSIITPINIFGNSALSMLIAKTYHRLFVAQPSSMKAVQ